jgi:glycosyltransferase involved in cell wall biosynthesis
MTAPETTDTAPRLRILHVFRAPLGGLFRNVLDLTHGQLARGHDVGIFCDASTGGARAEQVLAELAPRLSLGVTRAPMSRYPSRTDLMAQIGLIRRRNAVAPDVVHCHGSKGGLYGRLPALFDPMRRYVTAYTPHGGSFNYKPGGFEHRVYMGVERMLESATDMFTFESRYIHDRFVAYVGHSPRTDHRIVLNGVADAEFEPIAHLTDIAYDLVYLGELRSAKGIDTLIEALALLKGAGRTPSLLMVGSGPEEEQLKALAQSRAVADQITWRPPGPIRSALARARIMVVPSRAESLPYVVLEAAAAAQPLVSTDVGGIPEIYGPHHAHRLIKPNSAPALAEAIALALAMAPDALKAEANDLAAFVRRHFTLDQMIEGAIAGYRAALAKRRGADAAAKADKAASAA